MQQIRSHQETLFHKTVLSLINDSEIKGNFIFKVNKSLGANKSLKEQSQSVADVAGLYFVFVKNQNEDSMHSFTINNELLSLIYFGKAGQKADGTYVKQKLKGRINNVVSDSSKNLKDIKRGEYWEIILKDLNKSELYIIWMKSKINCVKDEQLIYSALGKESMEYPILNSRLGRPNNK